MTIVFDFPKDFAQDAEFVKLLGWQDDMVDLTVAALEIARDAYPRLEFAPVLDWIASRGDELRGPVARAPSDEAVLSELADCLAGKHGIRGTPEIYDEADGSFLHRVIERKTGIPISLSVLYMAVAKQAGIELLGVAAPAHFLTCYETFDEPLFVDAFAAGKVLTLAECLERLDQTQELSREAARKALEPVGPRPIVTRMLNNLKTLYAKQRDWGACWKVQHRLLALQPGAYGERRDWAVISIKAGRSGPGLAMLDDCLKTCPQQEQEFLQSQRREALGKLAQWN